MTEKARNSRASNALKGAVPATAQIQMRVIQEVKNRYVAQAQREGMKLSEWIQHHLNDVCQSADEHAQLSENIAVKNTFFRVYNHRDKTWRTQERSTGRFGITDPLYTTEESQAGFFWADEIKHLEKLGAQMAIQIYEEAIPYTPTREEIRFRNEWNS